MMNTSFQHNSSIDQVVISNGINMECPVPVDSESAVVDVVDLPPFRLPLAPESDCFCGAGETGAGQQLLTAAEEEEDTDGEPDDHPQYTQCCVAMSTTATGAATGPLAPTANGGGGMPVKVRGGGPAPVGQPGIGGRPAVPPKPQIDAVRYSMANVKESVDWELDALLGELFALQSQLCSDTGSNSLLLGMPTLPVTVAAAQPGEAVQLPVADRRPNTLLGPPHSPGDDHDSAFGDATSMESAAASSSSVQFGCRNSTAFSSSDSCRGSLNTPSPTQQPESPSTSNGGHAVSASLSNSTHTVIGLNGQRDSYVESSADSAAAAAIKAQKIKEALEKMKEANIKKLYVKFFTDDGGAKSILVDERWTVAETLKQLADRCRLPFAQEETAIVEEYPELYLHRIYEDHELLVENILLWTRDSPNKLYYTRRPDKYAFFHLPQQFLLHEKSNFDCPTGKFDAEAKQRLISEFFSSDPVQVPELEGWLWLKADGKKSWKRHFFVLRSSGLYYSPKGKTRSTKDLQCLMGLTVNQVYTCTEWRKKYKAPTEFGFAIKHPQIQVKASKYIKYVCAEDEVIYQKWLVALRIAKNQRQLYDNYMANCNNNRSNSIAGPLKVEVPVVHEQRIRDSRSSGLDSPASRLSSNGGDHRSSTTSFLFDNSSDQTGTIKRQPNDLRRCSTHDSNSSPNRRISTEMHNGGGDDSDSDEEHFPPPPPPIQAVVQAAAEQQQQQLQNGHHHHMHHIPQSPTAGTPPRLLNGHATNPTGRVIIQAQSPRNFETHVRQVNGNATPNGQPPPKPIPPTIYTPQATSLLMNKPMLLVAPQNGTGGIIAASPATPKKAPPLPPKRADSTRLQCVSVGNSPRNMPMQNGGNQALQSELELAMARRLQKMEQLQQQQQRS